MTDGAAAGRPGHRFVNPEETWEHWKAECDRLRAALAAAELRAWCEGRDAAARVADDHAKRYGLRTRYSDIEAWAAECIAAAIRALAPTGDRPHEQEAVMQTEVKQGWSANPDAAELLEQAWGIIANVSESDWGKQREEWRNAAASFRDRYFAFAAPTGDRAEAEPDRA